MAHVYSIADLQAWVATKRFHEMAWAVLGEKGYDTITVQLQYGHEAYTEQVYGTDMELPKAIELALAKYARMST